MSRSGGMRLEAKRQPLEAELIQGCLQGDRQCCKLLYEQTASVMFGICLRYASDFHEAEDILQEGYIKVFRYISQYRGDGPLEGWMRRIFINTALAYGRRHKCESPTEDPPYPDDEPLTADVLSRLETFELLELVQNLPRGYRMVFNLYVIDGYSHKEIAGLLGISEGTSKSQLARARSQLRKMLANTQQKKTYAKAF
ncbi:MAG: sigma-70 family RNA polymerase sigma factor [Chitinophagales bacterium]|nr:sigma-70 family RNA polymerase sigma factor [Chitinophagales bacterium]MDW8428558.1 sigma-70 family RNA polymerase sigma factor [Chitinophagales bacterium]